MYNVVQAHREKVGRRIRLARQAKGLSHDQLGAKVGTSRQHLIKLEKGLHLPGPAMLTKIAEATDRSEAWLSGEDDDEESDPVADLMHALNRWADRKFSQKHNEPGGLVAEATPGSVNQGG